MASVALNCRMDESLKDSFYSTCDNMGLSPSAAINLFARAVVREQALPFPVVADTARTHLSPDIERRRSGIDAGFAEIDAGGGSTLEDVDRRIRAAKGW